MQPDNSVYNQENVNVQYNPVAARPFKRPGFTTFWLWFIIVVNVLVSGFLLIRVDIVNGMLGIPTIIAAIALLYNKKWGWWLFVASVAFGFVYGLIQGADILNAARPFVSLIILYGTLQAKRDGQSTWEHLQ